MEELAKFGVDRAYLQRRVADKNVKDALKFQIQRVKQLEEKSRSGIEFLHPSSRPCIEAARILYCGIVDAVEAIDYEVFDKRAKVSMTQRLKVAVPAWREGVKARNEFGQGHVQGIAKVI
jgi:phytoene synthase